MSIWLRDSCIGLCFAVFSAAQAVSFGSVPAAAEPGGLSAEQGGAGQSQSGSEQEPAGYNGGDIARPQNPTIPIQNFLAAGHSNPACVNGGDKLCQMAARKCTSSG